MKISGIIMIILAFGLALVTHYRPSKKLSTVTRYEQVSTTSCLSRSCSDIFNSNVCYTSGDVNNLRTAMNNSTTCGSIKETNFIYKP